MPKGRKSTPDQVKKIKGTNQPCRLDDPEGSAPTLPMITKLPPPRNLGKHGKRLYKQVGSTLMNLGILNEINFAHFHQYCSETELYLATMEEMPNVTDLIHSLRDKQGNTTTQVKALRKIAQDALSNSRSLAAEFGLTPQAQSKILGRLQKNEKSELDTYMDGN